MKKQLQLTIYLVLSALFVSCEDQVEFPSNQVINQQNDIEFATNFGSTITRDFIGQIITTDNMPLEDVSVAIGAATVQTDENGVFILKNATVNEKFAYITAKKMGYIDGSRALVPSEGSNSIKIMMIPNSPLQTISSGVSSEVSINSGVKVTFDGAFQDQNGTAYSGPVSVAIFHLKPSDANISSLMPGMLFAQDLSNEPRILETFGMLHVELRGANGQELQIASGHTARLSMQIDTQQIASAPATIPLWHFDKVQGYWKEEGEAVKQGGFYVGNVSHFSWWNCDAPFPTVTLCMNLVNSNGIPLANVKVELVSSNSPYPRVGISNEQGQICGLVPANQSLTMSIYTNLVCEGAPFSVTTIGPFASNTTLPTIQINDSSILSTTVQGTLTKCDGTAASNGYVLMKYGTTSSTALVTNGAFSFSSIYCATATNFTLEGINFEDLQTTGVINYTYSSPTTSVGNLTSCNSITEFISYQVDSNSVNYFTSGINASWSATTSGNIMEGLSINAYSSATTPNQAGIYINGSTNILGSYTSSQFSIEGSQIGYIGAITTNTVQFNLSEFGAVGTYIDLTFSGTYIDGSGVSHTVTGIAHVLRDF